MIAVISNSLFAVLLQASAKKFNSDVLAVTDRCRAFEQSLGGLLKLALVHVEALQILDLPEFLQHAKEELADAVKSDKVSVGACTQAAVKSRLSGSEIDQRG